LTKINASKQGLCFPWTHQLIFSLSWHHKKHRVANTSS